MPASESGIPLLQFWPTSNRTSRVVSSWIAPDYHPDQPNPLWDTRLANWERILFEDLQYAPQIQESLERKGLKGMHLNYQESRIYHWHDELERHIGPKPLPPWATGAQGSGRA